MTPNVTVILPVYNQGKYLEETIESILRQQYKDFELLIVDDGSTDNSSAIIRRFQEKDARVLAFFESNSGKSLSTNFLVKKARTELCAFMDADDVMLEDRLLKQVVYHQANPDIDASSCHCYYINEKGNMFGIQRYSVGNQVAQYNPAFKNEEFIICSYTGLMVTKKAYLETGGLTKKFEPCEDFEFFNRLTDSGYRLTVIPEVLMKYRIHQSAITVKRPLLVLDTVDFVKHCIRLRRSGKPEISFEDFRKVQKTYSWWKKMNKKRFKYSMIYFRNAGFSRLSKDYLDCAYQLTASLILSPDYVAKKIVNYCKK